MKRLRNIAIILLLSGLNVFAERIETNVVKLSAGVKIGATDTTIYTNMNFFLDFANQTNRLGAFTFGPICTNVSPNNYAIFGPIPYNIIVTNLILHGDGGTYVADYFMSQTTNPASRTIFYTGATYTVGSNITNLPTTNAITLGSWIGCVITNGASVTNGFMGGQYTW